MVTQCNTQPAMLPQTVRRFLQIKAQQPGRVSVPKGVFGVITNQLDTLLGKEGRRALYQWAFNVDSSSQLTDAQRFALASWVKPRLVGIDPETGAKTWEFSQTLQREAVYLLGVVIPPTHTQEQ